MSHSSVKPGLVAQLAIAGGSPGLAFKQFVDELYADQRLDAKTRELVFIGVQTALDQEAAVRTHIKRALSVGASRDEIVAAMLVAIVNGGASGALSFVSLVDDFATHAIE